ncbi:hypothetical protein [Streptomyces sp. NPDC048332]|uniref:hypothetical protein n=1 Tax=Streptomyces sp. NPDC048332 TaxID=3154619 RepID=UPI0034294221
MGCWTAYLIRLEDGSAWELDDKYGPWHLTGADERVRLVERVLAQGRRITEAPVAARACRGIALDLATRRYRFYSCALDMPRAGANHRESMALHQSALPGWEDWDVAHAWGGDEELRRLLHPGPPPGPADVPAVEVYPASRDYWFIDWEPEARRITVRHDELIADSFAGAKSLVSIISADATLTHWQLSNPVAPLLAHHGESLPGTLAAEPPFPLAAEEAVTDGVVIDLPARQLRYWTADTVSPGLVARMARAWPGWTVERLAWGHLGHLAAVGQHPEGLSMTDAELRERRWDDELIAIRNRARSTLPTEPRALISPSVRVIDRW